MKYLSLLIVAVCLIEIAKCAPTSNSNSTIEEKEEIPPVDPCETDELKELPKCDVKDTDCEIKNVKKRIKRQSICFENPQCSFCNQPQGEVANEHLPMQPEIVQPEIVATIAPVPEGLQPTAINETIIVEGNLESTAVDPSQPVKLIERNIVIENDNETHYYRGYVDPSSNITTIIRLTNLINNTNVINMPTTLNNTNINNIHVYSNKSSSEGGKFGLGYTESGPCCYSMKPGVCKRTTAGLKCRHKKTKVCGKQCTKKMIHSRKSHCNQIPQWPYLMCPPSQMQPPAYYPYYPQQYPNFYPPPQFEEEFDDDDDLPMFPEDDELDKPESGWVVHQEKCKIVSEDGLQITNCTQKNVEFEHPYARNSVNEGLKRSVRHTGKYPHDQQFQQQQPYMPYPMMPMQPIYFQPIPIFIPQYYPPQGQMNFYPQQMPMPPIDAESYYDEPEIKESNQYRHSRKHAKKHPIVYEHDEEL